MEAKSKEATQKKQILRSKCTVDESSMTEVLSPALMGLHTACESSQGRREREKIRER
jgi:hypothetical protein